MGWFGGRGGIGGLSLAKFTIKDLTRITNGQECGSRYYENELVVVFL